MVTLTQTVWIASDKWKTRWDGLEDIEGGGQASAKKVKHKNSGETGFLKILSKQELPKHYERRSRFYREATCYFTAHHHGIPKLLESNAHEVNRADYKPYLVTEYIDGLTLSKFMSQNKEVSINDACNILNGLCFTVDYIHRQNWVHRDIKPDNIILKDNDCTKPILLDFGLSYTQEDSENDFKTETIQELGNRFLRLQELLGGSRAKQDPRSDIAFLGGILFYLLTNGKLPYTLIDETGKMPHQKDDVRSMLAEKVGEPRYRILSDIFDKCFALNPSDRYESVNVLREQLNRFNNMGQEGHKQDNLSMSDILQLVSSDENNRRASYQKKCDEALSQIGKIWYRIAEEIKEHYSFSQSGNNRFRIGVENSYGYTTKYSTSESIRIKFRVEVLGDEIVIKADDKVLHRTSLGSPIYPDNFNEEVEQLFLQIITELHKRYPV